MLLGRGEGSRENIGMRLNNVKPVNWNWEVGFVPSLELELKSKVPNVLLNKASVNRNRGFSY